MKLHTDRNSTTINLREVMNKLTTVFILAFSVLLMVAGPVAAQSDKHEEHQAHGDHIHEVGVSLGITHLEHDDEFAPIVHLHYSKRLAHESFMKHFGIGLGLEAIIFEEMHYNVMGVFNIYPSGGFEISLSPGILFVEGEEEFTSAFAFHVEMGYSFDLDFIEIGPVIGASFSGDDEHYSIGVHIGKGF